MNREDRGITISLDANERNLLLTAISDLVTKNRVIGELEVDEVAVLNDLWIMLTESFAYRN